MWRVKKTARALFLSTLLLVVVLVGVALASRNHIGMLRWGANKIVSISVQSPTASGTSTTVSTIPKPIIETDVSTEGSAIPQGSKPNTSTPNQEIQEKNPPGTQGTQIKSTGYTTKNFVLDGYPREYTTYVPSTTQKKRAVVMVLHGGGGSAELMMSEVALYSPSFLTLAEEEDFLLVFPQGFEQNGQYYWNAGNCLATSGENCGGPAYDRGVDDIKYFTYLVNDLDQTYSIDAARVYVVGVSNGGMMAHRLGCEMSNTFAAISSVAGNISFDKCSPKHPMPVLQISATNDQSMPYEGGAGACTARNRTYASVQETVDFWKQHNACSNTSVSTYQYNTVSCSSYSSCRGNVEVELCTIREDPNNVRLGGHSWPGTSLESPRAQRCLKKNKGECPCAPTQDLQGDVHVWNFFKQHTRTL